MADNYTSLDPPSDVQEIAEKNERSVDEILQELEKRQQENQRILDDLAIRVMRMSPVNDPILQLEETVKEHRLEKMILENEVRKNLIILKWRGLYNKFIERSSDQQKLDNSEPMQNLEEADYDN